jgi:hypothetical protein
MLATPYRYEIMKSDPSSRRAQQDARVQVYIII